MSYYERMLQAEERDPQDLEPMPPRSLWEWYKAVVTGWIQEEDMTEFLLRHALGRAVDQETLRRGLKSRTLESRELEEFARVAVESGHAAIRWLEKTRRSFEENPQGAGIMEPWDMQQGRDKVLRFILEMVQQHHPGGRWILMGWEETAMSDWRWQARGRTLEAVEAGDHRRLLRVIDELRLELDDPGTAGEYAERRRRHEETQLRDWDEMMKKELEELARENEELERAGI